MTRRLLVLMVVGLVLARGQVLAEAVGHVRAYVEASQVLAGARPAGSGAAAGDDNAYARGLLAARAGQPVQAEQAWARAVAANPQVVPLVREQAPTNAAVARLAVETHSEDFRAWEWLGDAGYDPIEALQAHQRAAYLEPHANLVWEKIATMAHSLGETPTAAEAARHACELNPIRNGSCHTAGRFAYAAGDWAGTIQYYAMGDYPEHAQDWVQLISAARRLGRAADAEQYLAQAMRENPADYEALLTQ